MDRIPQILCHFLNLGNTAFNSLHKKRSVRFFNTSFFLYHFVIQFGPFCAGVRFFIIVKESDDLPPVILFAQVIFFYFIMQTGSGDSQELRRCRNIPVVQLQGFLQDALFSIVHQFAQQIFFCLHRLIDDELF